MVQKLFGTMRGRLVVAVVLVVVAAGGVAIYVANRGGGNVEVASADCSAAIANAEGLASEVRGEVAAFAVSTREDSVTDLAFMTPDDEATSVADFAGRTVLLNLWATWCGPCRAEMPALDRLQAELGSDAFQVVAVNIDTGGAERARDFLDEVGVSNLAFYSDSSTGIFNELKKRGLTLGLPVTLLIDGNGCRLGSMQGPAEWDSDDAKALIQAALET